MSLPNSFRRRNGEKMNFTSNEMWTRQKIRRLAIHGDAETERTPRVCSRLVTLSLVHHIINYWIVDIVQWIWIIIFIHNILRLSIQNDMPSPHRPFKCIECGSFQFVVCLFTVAGNSSSNCEFIFRLWFGSRQHEEGERERNDHFKHTLLVAEWQTNRNLPLSIYSGCVVVDMVRSLVFRIKSGVNSFVFALCLNFDFDMGLRYVCGATLCAVLCAFSIVRSLFVALFSVSFAFGILFFFFLFYFTPLRLRHTQPQHICGGRWWENRRPQFLFGSKSASHLFHLSSITRRQRSAHTNSLFSFQFVEMCRLRNENSLPRMWFMIYEEILLLHLMCSAVSIIFYLFNEWMSEWDSWLCFYFVSTEWMGWRWITEKNYSGLREFCVDLNEKDSPLDMSLIRSPRFNHFVSFRCE